jgi:hypothetical protein
VYVVEGDDPVVAGAVDAGGATELDGGASRSCYRGVAATSDVSELR